MRQNINTVQLLESGELHLHSRDSAMLRCRIPPANRLALRPTGLSRLVEGIWKSDANIADCSTLETTLDNAEDCAS
jgi:hypothetical protein